MNLNYIDIGVNLMGRQYQADRDKVTAESLAKGIGIIITGTDLKSDEAAINYIATKKTEGVWCTCGIHPHNADRWNLDYQKKLVKLIQDNRDKVAALGEIGLDYDRMFSSRENQITCFGDLLEAAEELGLPLFLHERAAERDFTKLMKEHRSLCRKSVVHCFTGTREAAYRYLQLGCFIGITGWICDSRRNKETVEAVKMIPLDRLMIETDAPYLTPPNKGLDRRNVPENIIYVAEKIARIKEVEEETVRQAVFDNTRRFFNI